MAAQDQMAGELRSEQTGERNNTRLTAIETLPEELLPHCQWLYAAIQSRRISQTEMLEEFNKRISSSAVPAISKSGLNRYVMRVRAGDIKRPVAVDQPVAQQTTRIFTPEFRKILIEKQGISTVVLVEATLSALIADKDI